MTTSTDPTTVELDDTVRGHVSRLAAIVEQRKDLENEEAAIRAAIRAAIPAGTKGTVNGQLVVTVTPNRRFDPAVAVKVVPAELLALCTVSKVDSAAARRTLPPALYEACQVEVGDPVVRLA